MARAYECSRCERVQVVGVIENGRSGYADPHVRCEGCGATGQFHFAPGSAERTQAIVEHLTTASLDFQRPEANDA